MAVWDLGSVSNEVFNLVDDIPDSISGTTLLNMIDRKRLYMEAYLGVTIGSTAIAEQYQPALVNFSVAQLLNFINVQGSDASKIKLGEFNIDKGGDGGSLPSAKFFEDQGLREMEELKANASKYGSYRTWA